MKGFMKGCAVTALILGVLGTVLLAVGGRRAGRQNIVQVVEEATDGRVQINAGGWKNLGFVWRLDFLKEIFGNEMEDETDYGIVEDDFVAYDIGEFSSFDEAYPIYRGEVEKYSLGSDFDGLDIEIGGCILEAKPSGNSDVYLEAEKAHRFQGYVEGSTLYIRADAGAVDDWQNIGKCKITLYLPEKYWLDNVYINIGAGTLDFEGLCAKEAYLEAGAGQVILDEAQVENLSLSVGAGRITIKDMDITSLDAEVGMGELVAEGAVSESVYIECSMGNVDLEVEGRQEDFDYCVSCSMGQVDVGGESFGGLDNTKSIVNGADKTMAVDCSMGNITIDFKD